MEKCTVLNIVKGRKICLPEKTWWLGTDKGRTMIKISEKLNDTNVANNLTHSTIEYDNCIRIPPNHNHIHGIEYKGATYNHIKVHTFCKKKVNISRGPQVIRLDGKIFRIPT